MGRPPLIIGVGNTYRRDDGVGPWVAARLRDRGFPTVEASGEGAGLIDLWSAADTVIVIDAMRSAGATGSIRRFDARDAEIPAGLFAYSSHLFGLAEAISMARELDRLPRRLLVYGIEGEDFGAGEDLSPPVRIAAEKLVARLTKEISAWAEDPGQVEIA